MQTKKSRKPIKKILINLLLITIAFTFVLKVLLTMSGLGLSLSDIYSQSLPRNDKIEIKYESSYFVSEKSYFEKQGKSQCGGFSSAYIMRVLGKEITGDKCYSQLKYKFSNGYVLPQALLDILKNNEIEARLFRGNLATLKTRLNENKPIIVLLGNSVRWQHYVTVVGYNKEIIYLYDSNKSTDNSTGYNRTMTNEEFLKQWNNKLPFFAHIYFVVE